MKSENSNSGTINATKFKQNHSKPSGEYFHKLLDSTYLGDDGH